MIAFPINVCICQIWTIAQMQRIYKITKITCGFCEYIYPSGQIFLIEKYIFYCARIESKYPHCAFTIVNKAQHLSAPQTTRPSLLFAGYQHAHIAR